MALSTLGAKKLKRVSGPARRLDAITRAAAKLGIRPIGYV
jgi:hypothetical protein